MKKIFCLVLSLLLLLTACSAKKAVDGNNNNNNNGSDIQQVAQELPSVKSMEELTKLIGANGARNGMGLYATESATDSKAVAPSAATTQDYSKTNTQVAGVDEADTVKTDGKYIYTIVNNGTANGVYIAALGETGTLKMQKVLKEFEKNFYPSELYVDDKYIVVIGYQYNYDGIGKAEIAPAIDRMSWGGYGKTLIRVFDKSDMNNITSVRTLSMDGSYLTSRKINSNLYIIANQYPYFKSEKEVSLPVFNDSAAGFEKTIGVEQIKYLPSTTYTSFLTMAGIAIDQPSKAADIQVYLGNANTVYMSQNNIYTATLTWEEIPSATANFPASTPSWAAGSTGSASSSSKEIAPDDAVSSIGASSSMIAPVLHKYKTTIYKFAAAGGSIAYKASGEVEGTLFNQFAMDEYNGNLRIATTTNSWPTTPTNNLYVLDSSMKQVGSITGIAKGETIYSVRFEGPKGYMVTYRRVDPLFVIDLSDPTAPKIEGELKVPGYSTYMHTYDQNHIIGFGMDTSELSNGAMKNTGMKMAMFDVSDPKEPKEKYNTTIGQDGSYSELLYNHKALLFSKDKGLIAFPISIYNANYTNMTQGLQVYSIDMQNSRFINKGVITQGNSGSYDYNYYVSRGLFVGDVIYAISNGYITAHSMDNLQKLSQLELK